MPAFDATDLCNAALTMCGVNPIASLDEDSDQARLMKQNYEHVVQNEMSLFVWPFNRKNATLSRLASAPIDETWDAAYQLPTDVLSLRAVEINGLSQTYSLVGDTIECNAGTSDTLVATYSYRSDEATWPPYFRQLLIYALAVIVSSGFTEQPVRARELAAMYQDQLSRARHQASTEDTTGRVPIGKQILSARHSRNGFKAV